MADLSPAAATMHLYSDAVAILAQSGEAFAIGDAVYLHTDNKYYKADADAQASSVARGIALTTSEAANDYFMLLTSGGIDLGCTLTVGATYYVSTTAGKICPDADIGSGDYVTILGVALTATRLDLYINASEVAKP